MIGGLWFFFGRPNTASNLAAGSSGQIGTGPVPVVVGVVEKKDVPIYFYGIGTMQAFNVVTVRTRVDGQIHQIAFKEGQDMKKGDLLVVVDPRPFQAALDQAIAKKAQDWAQLNNARVTFQRDGELLAKRALDQQTYDNQKYQVEQFDALMKADDANIESAQVQLDYTRIIAPIDGRAGIRQVDEGNIVHITDTNGIVVITQLKPISVLFTLPQQQLPQINEESAKKPLNVYAVDSDNTKPLGEGQLATVDNQIDPQTGTVKLKATLANDALKLWPGQFVNVRVLVRTQQGGLVVPTSVVQRGPQGAFAYVIKGDSTAEMRSIKVGPMEDGIALIEEGLKEGEQVVVDGQYKLQPGAPIEITNTQPAGNQIPRRMEQQLKKQQHW